MLTCHFLNGGSCLHSRVVTAGGIQQEEERKMGARKLEKQGARYGGLVTLKRKGLVTWRTSARIWSPAILFLAHARLRVALGGVPREQKTLKGHLPRVIYHQLY